MDLGDAVPERVQRESLVIDGEDITGRLQREGTSDYIETYPG